MIGFNPAHESVQTGKRTIRPFLKFLLLIPVILLADIVTAQTQTDIDQQFAEAAELFHLNEREEAISILNEISNHLCNDPDRMDLCAESKILQSTYSRIQSDYEESYDLLEQAYTILNENFEDIQPLTIKVYSEKSYLAYNQSDFEMSEKYSKKGVETVESELLTGKPRAWAYLALGHNEDVQGNYSRAVEAYQEGITALSSLSRDLEITRMLTQAHNNIGIAYRRLGQLNNAMEHYQKNLSLVREAFESDHPELALSYNSIGTVYYVIGDYGTAGDYFRRSAEILIVNFGENHSRTAIAFNNAGLSYLNMGDLDQATDMMERSLQIRLEIFGEEHEQTAIGYRTLASINVENEEYAEAMENYQKSLDVSINVYGENHPNLVDTYLQIGDLYIKMDEYEKGREHLASASSIIRERIGDVHPNLSDIHLRKGYSYFKEKNFERADYHYTISFNQLAGENALQNRDFSIEDITYAVEFIEVAKAFGDVRLKQYHEEGDALYLYETLEFYELATNTIDYLQTRYQSESSKLSLVDKNYSIYANGVEALFYLNENDENSSWLDQALYFSEMSRAKIALELLQGLEAREFGGVPEEVLEKERELNSTINHYFQRLNTEMEKGFDSDERIVSAYRDSLFYARRDLEQFTETLENDYPAYFTLKYETELADREQIVSLLNRDEIFLSYVVGEEFVYAIVVSNEEYGLYKLYKTDGLANEVEKLRTSVVTGDTEQYKITARSLYLKLLEPLEPVTEGRSLVIAPDQMLHYLPFEMLLTDSAGDKPYHQLPYLVRDRDVTYAPSATVLKSMKNRKPESPRNLFALAPFHQSEVEVSADGTHQRYLADLSPLPLTLYETQEISKLFGTRRSLWDFFTPEQTELFIDEAATKETLLSRSLLDFGYIHLATHAFVNESNPSLSGIALRGEDGSSEIAYVSDIYNLQMNADLVVLSACETGLGRMYKGEGLIGFTRAFIYAGASNLVVSMWKVNDQPTANLMIEFYRHIRNGDSYSTSLRKAKLSLIDHPEYAAPRNWAAFVLHGR